MNNKIRDNIIIGFSTIVIIVIVFFAGCATYSAVNIDNSEINNAEVKSIAGHKLFPLVVGKTSSGRIYQYIHIESECPKCERKIRAGVN